MINKLLKKWFFGAKSKECSAGNHYLCDGYGCECECHPTIGTE